MLTEQIELVTTSDRDYGIPDYVVAEAPIPPTVVAQKDVTDGLKAWLEHQECQATAGKFYEIGQVGFRHGIPLQKLIKVIRRWTEQAAGRNQKDRQIQDAAADFTAFVRHYLIRGYQDAAR